jgi:hypothetical protein
MANKKAPEGTPPLVLNREADRLAILEAMQAFTAAYGEPPLPPTAVPAPAPAPAPATRFARACAVLGVDPELVGVYSARAHGGCKLEVGGRAYALTAEQLGRL